MTRIVARRPLGGTPKNSPRCDVDERTRALARLLARIDPAGDLRPGW